jgi:predicted nucleotidyltransferase
VEPNDNPIIDEIIETLDADPRVAFAYLYGSFADVGIGNDIDIAVYLFEPADLHQASSDLKIALHKKTGLPPDGFDIRIVNDLERNGDLFGLLYLKNVLTTNQLLIDKDPEARAAFLETYSLRYRECEGLFQEVLS